MGLRNLARNAIKTFAEAMGYTVQEHHRIETTDEDIRDMLTISLADMVTNDFSLPVNGSGQRAQWLDDLADDFVQTTFADVVKAAYDTGDCIIVPAWNGRVVENIIIDADNFAVLDGSTKDVTAVAYTADKVKMGNVEYFLRVIIEYKNGVNTYKASVTKSDGTPNALPLTSIPKWANYLPEWSIQNVDRLLVGRMKCPYRDARHPNSVKGTPLCANAQREIMELRNAYNMLSDEAKLSGKFVVMPKEYFKAGTKRVLGDDGLMHTETITRVPVGKEKVIMATDGGSGDINQASRQPFAFEPTIRDESIKNLIEQWSVALENKVGVSRGVLSQMNDENYANVDNVRKTTIKTQAFIGKTRKLAQSFFDDLVYAWDKIGNYYTLSPMGDYELTFDWSDEYINTFADHMNGLMTGYTIGAADAVDYRMWFFKEPPDVAQANVQRIGLAKAGSMMGES